MKKTLMLGIALSSVVLNACAAPAGVSTYKIATYVPGQCLIQKITDERPTVFMTPCAPLIEKGIAQSVDGHIQLTDKAKAYGEDLWLVMRLDEKQISQALIADVKVSYDGQTWKAINSSALAYEGQVASDSFCANEMDGSGKPCFLVRTARRIGAEVKEETGQGQCSWLISQSKAGAKATGSCFGAQVEVTLRRPGVAGTETPTSS
ncbi:hypothetical protein HNP46_000397 [Pseudomonas nitritireducens]|uniref:Lipoprotein n=1 Tax=Pseudomonas nitroreducens TaxID=46680 RepID=A0A7W7KFN5_PSENT|nr:hypothetical protein [Pseudomonas nitritireducens]MBB4861586.1 hypothetical protein [Pseudomonas nitritireducens]